MKNKNDFEGIEINGDFKRTFGLLENSSKNVFITGRAGTGKSTFLQYFRWKTKKNIAVLAPTGVAAVNVKGQTIHSFFKFKPDITLKGVPFLRIDSRMKKVYEKLDLIIIDEISMVRADLMDCIDAFLKFYRGKEDSAFGDVQMIFIGDLYQLAPVVSRGEQDIFRKVYQSPYFFDSNIFKNIDMEIVELEKNYRQKDVDFIGLLNRIRTGNVEQKDIGVINSRCQKDFQPANNDYFVYLTTTNKLADKINYERVHELDEELFTNQAVIRGDVDLKSMPTHEVLDLKVGAQVIMLNNDSNNRWINGSIGKITDIFDSSYNTRAIQVKLFDGKKVEVEPFTWEIFRFSYNEKSDSIESSVVGSFRQFPIKLAWAVTIHKSQGKTFEKIILDVGRGTFCYGQIYVALSRCTTFEGIILKRPIDKKDIWVDERISRFLTEYYYRKSEKGFPEEKKLEIIRKAMEESKILEITYLKEKFQKNVRKIIPSYIRSIEYNGQKCLGVEAFCMERRANWIFRLNCILSIRILEAEDTVADISSVGV